MNDQTQQIVGLLDELGGDGSGILSILDDVELAEYEIDRALRQYPDNQKAVYNAFRMLQKPAIFRGRPEQLYRSYCQELLGRVATGEDTRPATDAEIVVLLSEASLAASATRTAGYLYMTLFRRIFGEAVYRDLGLEEGAQYMVVPERATEELHNELRKKGATRERVIKPKDEWRDVPDHRLPK